MSETRSTYHAELVAAVDAATSAGAIVREYYDAASARSYDKADGSPVTDADLAADRIIRDVLAGHFPGDALLTEEGADDLTRLESARCWIADPIDGTEQFMQRTGEFDVLVALVIDGRPVAAAGFQPSTGVLVTARAGGGSWVRREDGPEQRLVFGPAGQPLLLGSSKWFGAPENAAIVQAIASAIGAEHVSAAETGFSPRMFFQPRAVDVMIGVRPGGTQTMASEWDFAVADLVFHEAGGKVTDLAGKPFQYNKTTPTNEGGLIAAAHPLAHKRVVDAYATLFQQGGSG